MITEQKRGVFQKNVTGNHIENNEVKLTCANSEQKFTKISFFVTF